MKIPPVSFLLPLFLTPPLMAQSLPPGAPLPPGSMNPPPSVYIPRQQVPPSSPRADPAALQRDADELLQLTQSVHSDIGLLRRGLLDKDLDNKLKQIEKLSKHLRNEVHAH